MHDRLKVISDVLEVSAVSDSEHEKRVGVKACIQLLSELKNEGCEVSQLYYLLGYAWYLSSDTDDREKNIVAFFSRALELDFENDMAKVYLCHHFFDTRNYVEFLRHSQQLELYKLNKWRKLKFLEMKIISKLALGLLEDQEAIWYIDEYEKSQEREQPMITELFEFSKENETMLSKELIKFVNKWSRFWGLSNKQLNKEG